MYRCFSLQGSAKEKDNALIQPWFVENQMPFGRNASQKDFWTQVFFLRFPWAIPLQFKNSLGKKTESSNIQCFVQAK